MIWLFLLFAGTAAAQVSTSGLQLRLDLDGSGQTLADSSGQGNDCRLGSTAGTDANDPTRIAEGLQFDGGDFADCLRSTFGSTSLFAQGSEQFTVQVVVRQPSDANAQFAARSTGALAGFELGSQTGSGVQVRLRTSATTIKTPTPVDEWHLWTVRWDGTAGGGRMDDGSDTALAVGSDSDPSENLALGARSISTGGEDFLPDGSRMALALVYDRALTDGEMREQYCAIRELVSAKGIALSDSHCPTADFPMLLSGSLFLGAPARATMTTGLATAVVTGCDTVSSAVWESAGLEDAPFSTAAPDTAVGDACSSFGPTYPPRTDPG